MGIISRAYIKNFVGRYDKQVGVPYYSYSDFKDLKQEEFSFNNSKGTLLKYFYFYYDGYKKDKIVLFLHGLECGHAAYMAEINELCKRGFKVLAIDYTGCGDSEGKYLGSLYQPTKDVIELLDLLKLKEEIALVGHSLGGYTSLNILSLRNEIKTSVILAGFITPKDELGHFVKSNFLLKGILRYEKKIGGNLYNLDNVELLKTTKDRIFYIQSEDDQMVPFETAFKVVEAANNPSIKTLKMSGRKHNPNYTDSAIQYMNEVFGNFYNEVANKNIKTKEDRINYFKDVSLEKLVEQDAKMFDEIAKFIEK